MTHAMILAGAPNVGPLREVSDAPNEALVQIGDRTILSYVLESLLGSEAVDKVAIVGPVKELQDGLGGDFNDDDRVQFVPGGETFLDNLKAGAEALGDDESILVATSDIPMVTTEMFDRFFEACREKRGDFYYPVVPREYCEQKYPLTKRTYVNLKDGNFTGGNFVLVRPEVIEPSLKLIERFFDARKNPLALARILGLNVAFRYLTKSLTTVDLEQRVSKLVGAQGRVIISHDPEVGIDVDKPEDLQLARSALLG